MRALEQITQRASWDSQDPVSLKLIAHDSDQGRAHLRDYEAYLISHGVEAKDISMALSAQQPADIVSINVTEYRAITNACNQYWENLAATRKNTESDNFGCFMASNTAAMIADPRDLVTPTKASPGNAMRNDTIMQAYQKGKITSSEVNDAAKAKVSEAVK